MHNVFFLLLFSSCFDTSLGYHSVRNLSVGNVRVGVFVFVASSVFLFDSLSKY